MLKVRAMACLSVFKDGRYVVCTNRLFPTSDLGSTWTFEILEKDAASLKSRLGKVEEFHVDSAGTFSGVLRQLEVRPSTHPGLARLRDRATMYGVITVHKIVSRAKH